MNGPEEREQSKRCVGERRGFQDAAMKEFEAALGRAMQRVEVRAETPRSSWRWPRRLSGAG